MVFKDQGMKDEGGAMKSSYSSLIPGLSFLEQILERLSGIRRRA